MLAWFGASQTLAQDAPAPAPAEPVPVVAPPPVAPPPPAPAPAATVEATVPAPVVVEEAPPPAAPEPPPPAKPKLNIGVGLRTGLSMAFKSGDDVKLSLADSLDEMMVRPYFSGQLTDNVGATVNLEGTSGGLHIMDAILQLKFADELQLWIGQHIPANDRNNFCGPFYHNSWNFAIAVHSYPFDADARDRGFTFWGLLGGGVIKYHLSMVDLQPGRSVGDARLAGRVTLNLLDPENYYYASGTYYGSQDTLALGGVISYQSGLKVADGATDANMDGKIDNDFLGLSADLLFEKNLASFGVFTLEGGYWNFEGTGKDYVVNQGTKDVGAGFVGAYNGIRGQSFLGAVSWLSPNKVGLGKLQPNARIQMASKDAGDASVLDLGLAYIIDGYNHRWHVNYRHVNNEAAGIKDEDSVQFGAQLQL
jgi:hypothetical protein